SESQFSTVPIHAAAPSIVERNTAGTDTSAEASTGIASRRSTCFARCSAEEFSNARLRRSMFLLVISTVEDNRDDPGQMGKSGEFGGAEHRSTRATDEQCPFGYPQRCG